ncbi:hypothetical protein BT96DRAFT_1023052 [Gymnopus androsaceus JB14]|uniref:F-box domain-containing protein n=1 Tax=Gymnopus androsaceus JB14 TaxID=1447944 RepID=A0A6A4H5H7_9AGAR|nr:hypothetical protein BT96DRAFT_1023052 [Gymnopus androsaceus JB14]
MHHCLCIPEILHIIFSLCNCPTNAATAVVCKQWSEESLNVLWYRVDELKPLLRLFGELEDVSTGEDFDYRFKHGLTHKAWLRFQNVYQRRIRILGPIDDAIDFYHCLGSLGRIRSSGPLLPNLRVLDWEIAYDQAQTEAYGEMFMNDTVETLRFLCYLPNPIKDFESLFSCISLRMPHLTSLELFLYPCIKYQAPLLNLVQDLPNLTELVIPPFSDLSSILKGISDLPTDTSLSSLHVYEPDCDRNEITPVVRSYWPPAAFQVFLGPRNLKEIIVASFDPAPAGEVRELISRIAQTCRQIEEVSLSYVNTSSELINRLKSSPTDLVTFDDLQPLMPYTRITSFILKTACPLSLGDPDIERLAQSWPSLQYLYLSSSPGIIVPKTSQKLSLRCLLHLAIHCPKIDNLYLYLDAEHVPDDIETFAAFTRLARLAVGFSPINNSAQVTRFLSQILPPEVSLTQGCNVDQPEWDDTDLISPNISSKWREHWERVAEFLPEISQMRIEVERKARKNIQVLERRARVGRVKCYSLNSNYFAYVFLEVD